MNKQELQTQLEDLRERYWDAQDELGRIALAKAGVMSQLKELGDEC